MKYEELRNLLSTYMDNKNLTKVYKYYNKSLEVYSGMKRNTGEDYICHAIEVAYILAEHKMDSTTIGCALIHEAITLDKLTYEEIKNIFDEESAIIVNNISKISHFKRTFKHETFIEKYKRIIVGLADNPKVLFIKFADRLNNLKTIHVHNQEHQKELIEETQNIYIPIAHRLGMKKIMSELEDLCLKYTNPKEYEEILTRLNASKEELENCLESMKEELSDLLNEYNLKFKMSSRVKSVRGIYNKLIIGKKWENIYDFLGIRILVDKIEECYLVLGYIHSKYKPLPKRLKDYIANPKSNLYQSIHTTVFGYDNKIYEIQIRTYEMDELAEKGVASHWSYKEKKDGRVKNTLETRLETFRTLLEANETEYFDKVNKEFRKQEIYVFTPKGDIIELPIGSTPIDFAYKIHSEIGNTTISAMVNDKIEKLDYELEEGDIVKLITQAGKGPSKNWLNFVKTENAKGRIKSYFYKKEREKFINLGKKMLENEAKKRRKNINELLTNENISKLLNELKLDSIEDLYFSIATLKYLTTNILNKLDGTNEEKKEEFFNKNNYKPYKNESIILVEGSPNIKTSIASCCNPVLGEDIIGYVTKGYGIKVHSINCKNINVNSKRIINVSWNKKEGFKYSSKLNVYVDEKINNILEIVTIASKLDINIENMNQMEKENLKYFELSVRVKDIEILNKFIEEIKKLKYVYKIERAIK